MYIDTTFLKSIINRLSDLYCTITTAQHNIYITT